MRQEKYLDIRPSEVAANKVHKHLENLLKVRPRTYKKTLIRYKDLAYILIDCVDLILRFLTQDLLNSSGDNEFDELSDPTYTSDSDAVVKDIRNKLEETSRLFDTYNKLTTGNGAIVTPVVDSSSHIDNSRMAKTYADILENAAHLDFGYVEVNKCAELINYWYSTRMLYMSSHHKAYNISQLPNWICYIVLMFGKYHANGEMDFFIGNFKQWCDDANDDFSNKYAVPKDLTNLAKSSYVNDYTIDALIIYDLLMEKGYLPLVNADTSIVAMNPNFVVDLTKANNPDLDKVIKTRFSKRDKYAKQIGLTPTLPAIFSEGVKA